MVLSVSSCCGLKSKFAGTDDDFRLANGTLLGIGMSPAFPLLRTASHDRIIGFSTFAKSALARAYASLGGGEEGGGGG